MEYSYRGQEEFEPTLEFGTKGEMMSFNYFHLILKFNVLSAKQIVTGDYPITRRLKDAGWDVALAIGRGGPCIYKDGQKKILPDQYIMKPGEDRGFWVDAKHKSTMTQFQNSREFTFGVDRPHFRDYVFVGALTNDEVNLVILSGDGETKEGFIGNVPAPTGMYVARAKPLYRAIDRFHTIKNELDTNGKSLDEQGATPEDRRIYAINEYSHNVGTHGLYYWPESMAHRILNLTDMKKLEHMK